MNRDETVGFAMTVTSAEEYFKRVIEAEKKMGPLTRDEKITILKSMGSAVTMEDLLDMIAGKRVLIVKNNDK